MTPIVEVKCPKQSNINNNPFCPWTLNKCALLQPHLYAWDSLLYLVTLLVNKSKPVVSLLVTSRLTGTTHCILVIACHVKGPTKYWCSCFLKGKLYVENYLRFSCKCAMGWVCLAHPDEAVFRWSSHEISASCWYWEVISDILSESKIFPFSTY